MFKLKSNLFALALILNCSALFAQPAPPDSANRTPLPGIVILAVAGAAYGAKKTAIKLKEREDE